MSWKRWLAAGAILILLFLVGLIAWRMMNGASGPKEAPEAEKVLQAQLDMPFQVLIPGYLPVGFNRKEVEIHTDKSGPRGEAMIQLVYPARQGISLMISEWIPAGQNSAQAGSNLSGCICICRSPTQCEMVSAEFHVGIVRVRIDFSVPGVLSHAQVQSVMDTLGPAANRQVYTSINDVPVNYNVPSAGPTSGSSAGPAAVEVPLNASGVQELTLVVTPQGYSPAHFAVKKGVPVRLIFRQLGNVGCGNSLIVTWGAGKQATLTLASSEDQQVLEFTPDTTGDFSIHCPHGIYRGVMSVHA